MENPMISVVVPAYNCAPYLRRCMESILNQTYENLEVIVVDDESSDNTPEVLKALAEENPRVRFLRKKNGGEYAARLSGVEAARGDWIGFVDADDEIEPRMYERLLHNALTNHAEISHCGYMVIYGDGKVEYLQNSGLQKLQDRETGVRDLLEEKIMETGLCSKLFAKKLFAGLSRWMDFSIVNNGDLLMNYYLFSKADRIFLEDVCPYHYLIREGSASRHAPNAHTLFDPIRAREIILKQCSVGLKDDARRAMIRLTLCSLRDLALEERKAYRDEERKLLEILKEQSGYYGILSLKNRVQVTMALHAPWLYRNLYRVFSRLFRQ